MAEKPTIPPPQAQADERAPAPASTSVESDDAWAEVFVVSDGTGETAADTVRAAMLQFHARWRMRTFPDVRSATQARGVIEAAARNGALVVFTVVNREAAQVLRDHGAALGVPCVDLLGPLIANIAEHLKAEPRHEPGLLHGFSDAYFKRIEAVEFAVRHDDGTNLHTLHGADIVLTGVSRTSKTPLSMYLAQRGYKTGNVPLVPGVDPPQQLLELNPRKVFGLIGDVENLSRMRRARARSMGSAPYHHYADSENVSRELDESLRLFRSRGWRWIDVSGRAVEENASKIVEMIQGYQRGFQR
ncbi:MAG: kinase/pyrophosphorylase [Myxococcota bacterium]|jgi:regulator of PEP synthase PpsR (kinase-PPPase family)|nr:kinase/pyrophosphorylase [Myxococcota bacterium]